jgi:hypothetical protein
MKKTAENKTFGKTEKTDDYPAISKILSLPHHQSWLA